MTINRNVPRIVDTLFQRAVTLQVSIGYWNPKHADGVNFDWVLNEKGEGFFTPGAGIIANNSEATLAASYTSLGIDERTKIVASFKKTGETFVIQGKLSVLTLEFGFCV